MGHIFNKDAKDVKDKKRKKARTEQCQNKTRMSINILDSLLWEVALSEAFEVRLEDNESEIAVIDSEIEEKNKL